MPDPKPKYARVNPQDPSAWAQCDRCGFWRNMPDLDFQYEWSGTHLYNTGALVCRERCLDVPQEQFRTIILPPDPPPIMNSRVPNFAYEEQTVRITQVGAPGLPPWGAGPQLIRCLQNGTTPRILQFGTSS